MTPREQIAYLRSDVEHAFTQDRRTRALASVCDLAERALLTDDERRAVAHELDLGIDRSRHVVRVLRRLLGETP